MTTKSYFRIYLKALILTFSIVWLFFIFQLIFVFKEFKFEFIIVPSLLALVMSFAIAKIAILKRKLADQNQLFRVLTDVGQDFLYLRNPQGKFEYVSPYCKIMTGYTPEEFYQNTEKMDELIYPEDMPIWQQHVNHMFHNKGESESLVIRIVSKTGEIHWINHMCSSIFDYEGNFQGVRSSNIDITRREEVERLKNQFLKRMCHEFRTPMNGILGCIDLINYDLPQNSHLHKYVEVIQSSSERLLQTLDNILELSRLENAQIVLHSHKPTDLLELIQQLIEIYRLRARVEGKSLTFVSSSSHSRIITYFSRTPLECIFKNLLDNAVKFSRFGTISIDLQLHAQWLTLTITDQGIGIRQDFLPFIFDEFRQASEGDLRSFDGTGIGLSVVKKLLEKMLGAIDVHSIEGQGTSVVVQLPLVF